MDTPVQGVQTTTFTLDEVPKASIEISSDEQRIEFCKDFRSLQRRVNVIFRQIFIARQELLNKFCFTTSQTARRERRQVEVLRFPSSLPPMYHMKVKAVQQTGLVTLPFTANITAGSRAWWGSVTSPDSIIDHRADIMLFSQVCQRNI